MKPSTLLTFFLAGTSTITAASLPETNALEGLGAIVPRSDSLLSTEYALEKRKGGGGKGGGKSGGGTSGGTGRGSSSSNLGGSTKQGTGPSRSYGGGYYGGGAAVPYSAGSRTKSGLLPGALLVGGAGLLIFPGLWLHSVYPYYYSNPYHFYNASARNTTNQRKRQETGQNQTLPVVCLCQEYSVCGCDENPDTSYLNDLIGNGSYAALNKTLVTVSEVNSTKTLSLVINGTLPNGTTAPGGDEDAQSAAPGVANALPMGRFTGYYVMGAIALYAVVLL
ncbi:hypothetical protein K504DRAFT_447240 [Pleomassaria siparia CBS 279.74]|uniref:DUF7732 domain-containing protein n=1 Tax=Pleomassaria siparia CBS 279.74 TaxID=1314801 RepID=A0A6G1K456_9PLEO|nr:hypothetical protein K504DRAFT_447240 [Pleomassaria siparia CBS 279.74]